MPKPDENWLGEFSLQRNEVVTMSATTLVTCDLCDCTQVGNTIVLPDGTEFVLDDES